MLINGLTSQRLMTNTNSRIIAVDGNRFRFEIGPSEDRNGEIHIGITVHSDEHNGRKLLVRSLEGATSSISENATNFGACYSVGSEEVELLIRYAIFHGWNYKVSGKDLEFTSGEELIDRRFGGRQITSTGKTEETVLSC